MSGTYDYAFLDFTANLARVELEISEKLKSIIETFVGSRLDLPLKHIGEIAKVHSRTGKNLQKMMDHKKNEHLNLWKFCNIYSACSVDLDKAMRETRVRLRAKMTIDGAQIDKVKRRHNLWYSNAVQKSNESEKIDGEKNTWLKKFTKDQKEKLSEMRGSQKKPEISTFQEKQEKVQNKTTKSTPSTPLQTRTLPTLKTSVSIGPVALETHHNADTLKKTETEECGTMLYEQPAKAHYARPVYGDTQKQIVKNGIADNNKEKSLINIRTDVSVVKNQSKQGTEFNVYSDVYNPYVNIRPKMTAKPTNISNVAVQTLPYYKSKTEEVLPTVISVDCIQPTPYPRTCFPIIDPMSSQQSSSSAYSSDYSPTSANITTFSVENPKSVYDKKQSRSYFQEDNSQRF